MAGEASLPEWRDPYGYEWLLAADRACFAWEWLRRDAGYQDGWTENGSAVRYGLVRCEDPARDARDALPLWRCDCDPAVLGAWRADAGATGGVAVAAFDFRKLGAMLRVVPGDDVEHVRIGDMRHGVRIDLEGGGISTGAVAIAWRLFGIDGLGPPLRSLSLLRAICGAGSPGWKLAGETRAPRWILALRVHDALGAGASHQDIAHALFGGLVTRKRWRTEAPSIRLRVQRLARTARTLAARSPRAWFG
jgi:hypothetical protein